MQALISGRAPFKKSEIEVHDEPLMACWASPMT